MTDLKTNPNSRFNVDQYDELKTSNTKSIESSLHYKPQEWMIKAIDSSCLDESWSNLLSTVSSSVKQHIKELNYSNFSQLSQQEQAILIEKELSILSDAKNDQLNTYCVRLGESIDRELVRFINEPDLRDVIQNDNKTFHDMKSSIKGAVDNTHHPSNVDLLLETCSTEMISLLESSPLEMASTAKLFLNRNIPQSLRPYIWSSALSLSSPNNLNSVRNEYNCARL